ncbi:MAG: prenyltransferase [Sandaracinaceae bacterium]
MNKAWIGAAKPASWPKLLVPFVLGQAIGLGAGDSAWTERTLAFGLGLVFTVLDLLFIVFLNDWGDREVDAIKRQMFPKSSQKTVPDGLLAAHQLLFAGLAAGGLALAVAVVSGVLLGRPWLGPLAAGALGIFVAYTLPPLKLNYRGGGELLEMAGVGLVLPAFHMYLQGGEVAPGVALLPGFALLSLASAVASGLSDERSDRAGGKHTFVTRFGNAAGRRTTEVLAFAGATLWAGSGWFAGTPVWVGAGAALVAYWYVGGTFARSGRAKTDRFSAQRQYKGALHHAIWRGGASAAMLLAAWHLLLQ